MFCGLGFLGIYIYVLTGFSDITIGSVKNFFIIGGLLLIVAILEIIWELKAGFKLIMKLPSKLFKLIIAKIKIFKKKRKIKKIAIKINTNQILSVKELALWKERDNHVTN